MRGGVSMKELLDSPSSDFSYYNDVIESNIELSQKAKQIIL